MVYARKPFKGALAEMNKMERVRVEGVSEHKSKSGKVFWILSCSGDSGNGKVSIWDSAFAEQLKKYSIGSEVTIEVEQKGDYTNLKGIIADGGQSTLNCIPTPKRQTEYTTNREAKDAAMLTAYVKDICIKVLDISAAKGREITLKDAMRISAEAVAETYVYLHDSIKDKK